MPFPWKKMKSTRISKFVNDHLNNSQKRRDGSSLVVETGFPTSLVDLFMKNREKLKKQSKKKRNMSLNDDPVITESVTNFPSPVHSRVIERSHNPPIQCSSPLRTSSPLRLPSRGVNEIVAGARDGDTGVSGAGNDAVVERGVDANRILFAAAKIFLVVVLALGMKRLTVGITLSAFLLFFLEYVGKHVPGLLKPCSRAKRGVRLMFKKVWRFLRFKEDNLDQKMSQKESLMSVCSIEKTEMVESKGYLVTRVEEIQPENEIIEDSRFIGRLGSREIESEEIMDGSYGKWRLEHREIESNEVVMEKEESIHEVAEFTRKKSRGAKLKSKMKIFVPKKLRNSRKEHKQESLDIVREDNVLIDEYEDGRKSESFSSRLSSIPSERFKDGNDTDTLCALGESSDESAITGGEKMETRLSWGYPVLCSIVLIGLVGGRGIALLLTLSWFLLLKLGETLPRYIKSA